MSMPPEEICASSSLWVGNYEFARNASRKQECRCSHRNEGAWSMGHRHALQLAQTSEAEAGVQVHLREDTHVSSGMGQI